MEHEPGDYLTLVLRLGNAGNDGCCLWVDDGQTSHVIPLGRTPVVLRLWRARHTGTLRGTVRLVGTEEGAPIHSNAKLEQLVRAWLDGNRPEDCR